MVGIAIGQLNDDLSTFDEIHTFVNACLSCFEMWQSRVIERLKTKRKNKQKKEMGKDKKGHDQEQMSNLNCFKFFPPRKEQCNLDLFL